MGIRFYCPDCGRRLNIKAFLAGKRGICPHCDARLRIPEESQIPANAPKIRPLSGGHATAAPMLAGFAGGAGGVVGGLPTQIALATPADPIAEAPEAVWYVRPPSGGQYGPARGDVMRRWLAEGRVSADSMVWREGWADWQMAGPVFPALQPAGATVKTVAAAAPSILVQEDDEEQDISESTALRRPNRLTRTARKKSLAPLIVLGSLIVVLLIVTVIVLQRVR